VVTVQEKMRVFVNFVTYSAVINALRQRYRSVLSLVRPKCSSSSHVLQMKWIITYEMLVIMFTL